MAQKTILIIGAGAAGLATGCYAQMNGYRTHILEQHTRPGGLCTAWKRKGYTIDGCIHPLIGAAPGCAFYGLYDEVGALEENTLIPLQHLCRCIDEKSGQRFEITADLDRLAADLMALSPVDSPLIHELIRATRALHGFDPPVDPPAELLGPLGRLSDAWRMRRWLKDLWRYNVPLATFAGHFQHPFLRWSLSHLLVPQASLSALAILLAQLADGRLATVERGSLAFALAIARRYQELGGQITYGAPVEEILVEPRRGRTRAHAVGVRLVDGSEHRADVVAWAANGQGALSALPGRLSARPEAGLRQRNGTDASSIAIASYGIRRAYPEWPAKTVIRLQRPLTVAGREVTNLWCFIYRGRPYAPPGQAVVQARLASHFGDWNDLGCTERARYEAQKAQLATRILERLEAHLPGITAAVEMTDVATPYTFWRYTRDQGSAWEGASLPTPVLGPPQPKTLPGMAVFYMAGRWHGSKGSIPTSLCSGRQVVQLVCHDDKVPFLAPRRPDRAKGQAEIQDAQEASFSTQNE